MHDGARASLRPLLRLYCLPPSLARTRCGSTPHRFDPYSTLPYRLQDLVNPPPRLFRALGISSTTRRRPEPSTAPSNNGDGSGGGGFFGGSRAAVEPVAIDVDSDGSDYAALYPGDLRMSSDASTALLAPAKEQPIYT